MSHFIILTTLPMIFPVPGLGMSSPLEVGIIGKALNAGLWSLEIVNLYDYGFGIHKKIDDTPYGGGAGMVIMAEVLGNAINHVRDKYYNKEIDFYLMSPRGEIFNQEIARNIAGDITQNNKINCIICGRFEGIDQRVIDFFNIRELSIGQYVLSNGDIAAMIMIDAIVRLLPGVMGNSESGETESFSNFDGEVLIEFDHYTKPAIWNNMSVPEVLLSGHHEKIKLWRKENSVKNTKKLLKK